MPITPVTTSDLSHTLYHSELDEHYHSIHGAVQESKHVFIAAGFNYIATTKKKIKLLEAGFGTGLNCLLTLDQVLLNNNDLEIIYHSIEKFPLSKHIAQQLNHAHHVHKSIAPYYDTLHELDWNSEHRLADNFMFKKISGGFEETIFETNYDLVYFDAFAPRVQPELWKENILKKFYDAMSNNAAFVTYCSKGDVKRSLRSTGFTVETLPGPPGKREMTRAIKTAS